MNDEPPLLWVTAPGSGDETRRPVLGSEVLNCGFAESGEYHFSRPSTGEWSFVIDDEPVVEVASGVWVWTPGFFAGRVEATLLRNGVTVGRYLLDVAPHPDKLGAEAYRSLLEEVCEVDPALLFGEEPAQAEVGSLGAHQDPWLEFQRLRLYGAALCRALESIIRAPIRSRRHQRRLVPFHAIRRVDRMTAVTALANGTAATFNRTGSAVALRSVVREPVFDVPTTEEHFDGAANRCITASLVAVKRRARFLVQVLDDKVAREQSSGTRSPLAARWPIRRQFLTECAATLNRLQKRQPFSSVTRPETTAAGLNAVSAHPAYARAYRLCWQALRSGIVGDETQENMWLSPTWELYERWVFVRVVRVVEALCASSTGFSSRSSMREWHGTLADGARIQVLLQPTFPAFDQRSSSFRSLSGLREPDLVVTHTTGERKRFLVIDAKYRTSRANVLDAMASAHIYRDALRWDAERADYAVLAVPTGGGVSWLEAPDFIHEHRVGVLVASPDTPDNYLNQFLNGWVKQAV